ncbi:MULTISPECIES: TetR/AcrR family transcriptional regulator [unclassified Beijerinckia]|uniref:TetR/AcrR family transcriptional regulator n=1 Tax=unclassified Beijerinckia TaxID=2638183 RepID=UPI00089CAC8A|nr:MULTISPECIES: TetR/AcrR family transcriptional regulator [unclassified Beijerinckia]MDH7799034.1 AcrR family transcriptional regulator [Beijerinckia sp. GAS462]SED97186.1 transcriptional regulator, TetR family [Beijerinckia sp. 28-YEA-48]
MTPPAAPKRKRAKTQRIKDSPLKEADWIRAATDILVKENVRGINLDRLSSKMGVTKGSFYWHFNKRLDLLQAMLNDWRRRMTLNVIQTTTRRGGSSVERLLRVLLLPREKPARAAMAVENSMRDWARRSEQPLAAVREVDHLRLSFLEGLLVEHGLTRPEARRRAYLLYCIVMGDSILHDTVSGHVPDADYAAMVSELLLKDRGPGAEKAG